MVSSAVQYLDIYDNENLPKRKKGLKFIQMQIITICPNTVKLAKWPNLDTLIKQVNLTATTISNKKITTRLMPRQLAVELIVTEFLNRRCLPTYLLQCTYLHRYDKVPTYIALRRYLPTSIWHGTYLQLYDKVTTYICLTKCLPTYLLQGTYLHLYGKVSTYISITRYLPTTLFIFTFKVGRRGSERKIQSSRSPITYLPTNLPR